MTVTQRERRDLYDSLEQALGSERADTLMQLLPEHPADELVTISYFQSEMGALRADLKGEMAALRGELRGEMAELRSELRIEMSELRTSLESRMTRWMATIMTGNTIAVVTALAT